MKKEFTKREKILLLVLAVLVIGLGYYKFGLQPVSFSPAYKQQNIGLQKYGV